MNTVVKIRCDFDPTFPDLKSLPKGRDRIPGRALAELVVSGLRKRGFNASDVINEEPFFVTRCHSGDYEYRILSCLTYPDPAAPVWEGRLRRRPNKTHSLDGGIALQSHVAYHGSAASDMIRWA